MYCVLDVEEIIYAMYQKLTKDINENEKLRQLAKKEVKKAINLLFSTKLFQVNSGRWKYHILQRLVRLLTPIVDIHGQI